MSKEEIEEIHEIQRPHFLRHAAIKENRLRGNYSSVGITLNTLGTLSK